MHVDSVARAAAPFFSNYRPQFFFRTADVTAAVTLPEDRQMVMPGDNAEVICELVHPMPIEEGLRFAFREGGRTGARLPLAVA